MRDAFGVREAIELGEIRSDLEAQVEVRRCELLAEEIADEHLGSSRRVRDEQDGGRDGSLCGARLANRGGGGGQDPKQRTHRELQLTGRRDFAPRGIYPKGSGSLIGGLTSP
jgi:hypothetical protein